MPDLTHVDASGAARMVDVGPKPPVAREAVAEGAVVMLPATVRAIADGRGPKGDALAVARVAGIMAAKRCADLIPLCHTLPLEAVEVAFELPEAQVDPPDAFGSTAAAHDEPVRLRITATARTTAKTGVEMEALAAVTVAALTLYDMCKAVDPRMSIDGVRLVRKTKAEPTVPTPTPPPRQTPTPTPTPAAGNGGPPPRLPAVPVLAVGRLWTAEEDERLRREFTSGVHADVIALAHKCPPAVIQQRLAELGLIPKRPGPL